MKELYPWYARTGTGSLLDDSLRCEKAICHGRAVNDSVVLLTPGWAVGLRLELRGEWYFHSLLSEILPFSDLAASDTIAPSAWGVCLESKFVSIQLCTTQVNIFKVLL